MYHPFGLAYEIFALGVELARLRAEVVVYGGALEYALLHAPTLAQSVPVYLHYHAQALNEEYAAEYGQHEFLVYDYCRDGYYASYRERTRVAHEHLGRVGVIPQETYERAHEGAHEHHEFLRARDVHYVQIGGKLHVRAHIGQNAQCHAYYGRVAGTHAVHAVVEVGTV